MMDDEIKVLYFQMATEEKKYHIQTFPDFAVKPRKSEDIVRRRHAPLNRDVSSTAADVADEDSQGIY